MLNSLIPCRWIVLHKDIYLIWFRSGGIFLCLDRRVQLQGPVVQSIVSLPTSLRCKLVQYMLTTLANPFLFLLKNVRIFCNACKRFSHFPNKITQHICDIYVLNFNETLTNDVVNFEQLAPDFQWCWMDLRVSQHVFASP